MCGAQGACAADGGLGVNDPYRTLGVAPTDDLATIQAAYRRLMREHHPDRSGAGDDDRAQEINAAFALLKDPARRARYDAQRQDRAPLRFSQPYEPPPIVRRRGPSLEARQRRLRQVRWVKRGLLAGACVMVGLGVVGAAMNYRAANRPWHEKETAAERLVVASQNSLHDRLD